MKHILVYRVPHVDGLRWVYIAPLPNGGVVVNLHDDLQGIKQGLREHGFEPVLDWLILLQ